ncbi:MAG: hypothetical protein N2203_08580 [Bacteroidia bacterium]|nr:hypothetical protein [Bacteroidia bacterium]
MKVENNKVVAVDYTLNAKKGNESEKFIEQTSPDHPFVFLFGSQQVIPDFNHPLAGYDLHFTGKIKSVREATPEELAHGHAHGLTGHEGHTH